MRTAFKRQLSRAAGRGRAGGASLLIYHRVGGGSPDERDLPARSFAAQLDALDGHDVVSIDAALDRLDAGDRRPSVVLTFDDGFADVYEHAWPELRDRRLPFTLYLAAGHVGGTMHWEGSTAREAGSGLAWDQLVEMAGSGLCTVGNHTFTHPRPPDLTPDELDRCSAAVEAHLGPDARPRHFAYTWGVDAPWMHLALRARFRSAATGRLGRNLPGYDPMAVGRHPGRGRGGREVFLGQLGWGVCFEKDH
ncbi:MAG: polysaccharide deacetylase family protein, partial [Acidimicrobiales bacterium]